MTSTDICNLALDRLGEAPVTSIGDSGKVPELCTRHYAHTVQALLREHRWNFAIKNTLLRPAFVTPTAYADNGDGLFRVTKTAHGLVTDDRVTFRDSENYQTINGTWRVTRINDDAFDLEGSVFDGSGTVDGEYAPAAVFDWAYSIALPTDCLRALEDDREEQDINVRWTLESGRILTDSDELEFRYVEDVTDVARFDPLFVDALTLMLAIKMEKPLRGSESIGQLLAAELLQITKPIARRVDANEGQKRDRLMPSQSKFVAARRCGV